MANSTFSNLLKSSVNQVSYAINTALLQVNVTFPAKIISVSDDNLTATIETIINPVGINQQSPDPVTITNVPISQEVGGNAGIIIEYQKDDIVLCSVIQRDISLIKKAWLSATARNPASYRKFNISDAVIIKQLSNKQPTVFIKITKDGITIDSATNDVAINCANAKVTATTSAAITVTSLTGNATIVAHKIKCAKTQGGLSAATGVVIAANGAAFSTTLYSSES